MKEVAPFPVDMVSFFRNSWDTITIIGAKDGVVRYVNPAFETLYGISADAVVGQNVSVLWPENTDDFPDMTDKLISGEGVSAYETRRMRSDGEWIYVSLTISPIVDEFGNIYAYLTVGRDITEAKRMEQTLREVGELFRLIEDNISDMVSILNPAGIVEYASKSHQLYFGLPAEQMAGRAAWEWVHPDDSALIDDIVQKLLHDGSRRQAECRLYHTSGHWIDVEMIMTPVVADDGTVIRVIVVSRDITDRRHAEQLVRQTEKLSVVSQLGAALAHEIRNPLTSVKGFLQLIRHHTLDDDRYFDIVLSEIKRIEDIIGEFLTTAKPDVANFRTCDVREVLRQSVDVMQAQAHMQCADIQWCHAPHELLIRGDQSKLKQVFMNLLKNAIESMPGGGIIHVSADATADEHICIRVTDQGCGIPANLLPQLGTPFYTIKEKGTGLGLAVSSRVLHEHGGDMQFSSETGKGTTVQIRLPLTTEGV